MRLEVFGFFELGGGANFFKPPDPKGFESAGFFYPVVKPGMLILIFSPSFREKSLLGADDSFYELAGKPLAILSYFLKSSSPAIKSNESFLSGKPIPTMAFCPFSFCKSNAKNLEESKHLWTMLS